jgi:hypothetical protein
MEATVRQLSRDEANALWKESVQELDLHKTFGKDTDPDKIAGETWLELAEDGVPVGIVWLKRWIKNSEAVIAFGRCMKPSYRQVGAAHVFRQAIRAKIREIYPGAKTLLALVYSTNPKSLAMVVTQPDARVVGVIPVGDGVLLYIFVLVEWS